MYSTPSAHSSLDSKETKLKAYTQAKSFFNFFKMRFTSLVSAFALVAIGQAFTIPKNTAPGVYEVTTRDDGTVVHQRLPDAERVAARALKRSPQGQDPGPTSDRIWCGCGFTMTPDQTDAVVANLKNQMDNGKQFHTIH